MERKVIVITGPTCSGKTALGVNLAKRLTSEIISADSRQVYKYLDIGTAKPSNEELTSVEHHFIDILLPDEEFNASQFEIESLSVIRKLHEDGKIPVVVGGSGLYIKALIDGIFNSVDTDEDYRNELHKQMDELGKEYIYELLKKVDPESASAMLPQNWKRVIRALEVYHITGKPIWQLQKEYKREDGLIFVQFGLNWDRKILYKNIEQRVDRMIESGLVDETKRVLDLGYSENLNSLNTVGYKETISYLKNDITLDRAIELIKRNTRRYAKRQMTWFRGDERIQWLEVSSQNNFSILAEKILQKLKS